MIGRKLSRYAFDDSKATQYVQKLKKKFLSLHRYILRDIFLSISIYHQLMCTKRNYRFIKHSNVRIETSRNLEDSNRGGEALVGKIEIRDKT